MNAFDEHDLRGFVDRHLVCTYDNGWNYEICVKNDTTLDYRIHSGIVGDRWVRDQQIYIVRIGESVYKISWTEPTGTNVSLTVDLGDKLFRGTIFFPRWVINSPEETVCFQNDHIPLMIPYRDTGPAHPTRVADEFVTITFVRNYGANNDDVIACTASELPRNFPENLR